MLSKPSSNLFGGKITLLARPSPNLAHTHFTMFSKNEFELLIPEYSCIWSTSDKIQYNFHQLIPMQKLIHIWKIHPEIFLMIYNSPILA